MFDSFSTLTRTENYYQQIIRRCAGFDNIKDLPTSSLSLFHQISIVWGWSHAIRRLHIHRSVAHQPRATCFSWFPAAGMILRLLMCCCFHNSPPLHSVDQSRARIAINLFSEKRPTPRFWTRITALPPTQMPRHRHARISPSARVQPPIKNVRPHD